MKFYLLPRWYLKLCPTRKTKKTVNKQTCCNAHGLPTATSNRKQTQRYCLVFSVFRLAKRHTILASMYAYRNSTSVVVEMQQPRQIPYGGTRRDCILHHQHWNMHAEIMYYCACAFSTCHHHQQEMSQLSTDLIITVCHASSFKSKIIHLIKRCGRK